MHTYKQLQPHNHHPVWAGIQGPVSGRSWGALRGYLGFVDVGEADILYFREQEAAAQDTGKQESGYRKSAEDRQKSAVFASVSEVIADGGWADVSGEHMSHAGALETECHDSQETMWPSGEVAGLS